MQHHRHSFTVTSSNGNSIRSTQNRALADRHNPTPGGSSDVGKQAPSPSKSTGQSAHSRQDAELHSVTEIARRGGVSAKTIRRLIKRGELKSHRIGTQIRVSEAEWQAYLDGARQS